MKRSLSTAIFLALVWNPLALSAQETLTVTVAPGQQLRQIAEEYLADANLWQELLDLNDLETAAEVRPGMRLEVPRNEVSLAVTALRRAREEIDRANEAGAGMLASETIQTATQNFDAALEFRKQADWKNCREQAAEAAAAARRALEQSEANRHVGTKATLSKLVGAADGRNESDLTWQSLKQGAELGEGHRVRTRSASHLEIVLPDKSRLSLEENSQAVIRNLRRDTLARREEAKVTLLGGEMGAVLGNRNRKSLELAIPGVKVKNESKNYWASRRDEVVRIANYDESEMEIETADGGALRVGQNQGAFLSGMSSRVLNLLPAPQGLSSKPASLVFQGEVELRWQAVEGAETYWVQIAEDSAFQKLRLSTQRIRGTSFKPPADKLSNGTFYWRVRSVDGDSFPGPPSTALTFRVVYDSDAPQIVVFAPQEGAPVDGDRIEIRGRTEPGAAIRLGDREIDVADDGSFVAEHDLDGTSEFELIVEDAAGNVGNTTRRVARVPADTPLRLADGERVVLADADYVLRGATLPHAIVRVFAGSDAEAGSLAETAADADGNFAAVLSLDGNGMLTIDVLPRLGAPRSARLYAEIDEQAPEIVLVDEPSTRIDDDELLLRGRVDGATELTLDGEPVELGEDGAFTALVSFQGDAERRVVLEARDASGRTRRLERRLVLDEQPPRLLEHRVETAGPTSLRVSVRARDASGPARLAPARLEFDGRSYASRLILNRAEGRYVGYFDGLPPAALKRGKITVSLSDVLGNQAEHIVR